MSPDLSTGSSVCGILDRKTLLFFYLVFESRRALLRDQSPMRIGVVHMECEQQ